MSQHPNVILLLTLTPDDLARKTHREIIVESGVVFDDDVQIPIGTEKYNIKVMESRYDSDWQIGAQEGDIIIFDLVTYGYGEQISWEKLAAQKEELASWASDICMRHRCKAKISVTANYW